MMTTNWWLSALSHSYVYQSAEVILLWTEAFPSLWPACLSSIQPSICLNHLSLINMDTQISNCFNCLYFILHLKKYFGVKIVLHRACGNSFKLPPMSFWHNSVIFLLSGIKKTSHIHLLTFPSPGLKPAITPRSPNFFWWRKYYKPRSVWGLPICYWSSLALSLSPFNRSISELKVNMHTHTLVFKYLVSEL